MKKRPMAAALILPLVLIAPAKAQGPADARSDFRNAAGPSATGAASAYLPLGGASSGFRLSSTPIVRQDGSAGFRKTLVGSWPMSPGVNLGVGLIEVTRMSRKGPALRRFQSPRDDRGDRDRIAAIGVSIDF